MSADLSGGEEVQSFEVPMPDASLFEPGDRILNLRVDPTLGPSQCTLHRVEFLRR